MSTKPIVSATTPSSPLVDPKTGIITFAWMKWFQNIGALLNEVFDNQGSLVPGSVPDPTPDTLGGVVSAGPVAHEWVSAIDTAGIPQLTQPAFSDLSGSATPAQVPALSALSGSATPAQLPVLSDLRGIVTPAQVPALSALSGQIATAQLPASGLTVVITTAKLTALGTNGSQTFTNGILTAQVQAT